MNVYMLIDPNDQKVKYVGITRKSPEERLRIHIRDAKARLRKENYLSKKDKWLLGLALSNKKPIIKLVFKDITEERAIQAEIDLIKMYGRESDGGTLKNVMKGII